MGDNTNSTKPADILKQGMAVAGVRQAVTPKADTPNEGSEGIVIKGLGSDTYIQEAYLILEGYMKDPLQGAWIQYRTPVMNEKGIGNFIKCLHVLKRIDFSNFDEKQIKNFVFKFFKTNFPQFIFYAKEFDLHEEDFNIIKTELFYSPLAAFNNAKNAGHRNVVRGTLSENVFLRALGNSPNDDAKKNKLFGVIPKFWSK